MKKILLGVSIVLSVWFVSCKKSDVDFNKYQDITINPEILTPLAQAKVVASDLLKQDSIIKYDPDGLIRLTFKQDSVFNLIADSILKDVSLGASTTSFSIGELEFAGQNQSIQVSLQEMSANTDAATQAALQLSDGTNDTFPAVSSSISTITNLTPSTEYESLKISNGFIVFSVRNGLPTELSSFSLSIYDNLPTQQLLGTINISNLAPGATAKDSINITGKILSNELSYSLPSIELAKSNNEVPINLQDVIQIEVAFSQLKCIGGRAKLPSQTLAANNISLDVSDANSDIRLKNIELGLANVDVKTNSSLPTAVNLKLTLTDATQGGGPLGPLNISAPIGNSQSQIDLSNTNINLGSDPAQEYNILRADIVTQVQASSGMVDFDSSDKIEIEFSPSIMEFAYVDGYLGQQTYDISIEDLDVSQLAQLGNGIRMENPRMHIYVTNSFGIPILVEIDIISKDEDNNTLPMNAQDMNFPYPSIAERGTEKSATFTIDKTNSDIVDCLGMPATSFEINATATMNPDGFTGVYENHIENTSGIVLGFDADIPITFSANNFSYTDTVEIGETLLDSAFQLLELSIKTINGFPLGGTIDLMFMDENYVVIDSLKDVTLLQSGICDANGRVTQRSTYLSEVLMNEDFLENLRNGNANQLGITTKFDTYNSGTQPVSIYTDTRLDVILAFRAKAKFKLNAQ